MLGNCALCKNRKELQQSHLFPKFLVNHIKKFNGSSDYVRHGKNPNLRKQDGHKPYLLCRECEGLFSKYEYYFSQKIFQPTVKDGVVPEFIVTDEFFYFFISLVWRLSLQDNCDSTINSFQKNRYENFIEDCRLYLNGENISAIKKYKFHFIPTDSISEKRGAVPTNKNYNTRTLDATKTFYSWENHNLIYDLYFIKIPFFLFFVEIYSNFNVINSNLNTELIINKKSINTNAKINNIIYELFENRINSISKLELSPDQQKKINEDFSKNLMDDPKLIYSESAYASLYDCIKNDDEVKRFQYLFFKFYSNTATNKELIEFANFNI